MPTLLTFGDSNTHGTPPMTDATSYHRFGPDIRWPCVAHRALGQAWDLVEEGLPGRTAQYDDPVMDGLMNGYTGLRMALQSHGPIDVLTIMLGTNDVKTRFGATPETVMGGIAGLLDLAMGTELQTRHDGFKILLICPPPIIETGVIRAQFWGGTEKTRRLSRLYAALAEDRGIGFLDAGQVIRSSPLDGIHFDATAHAALGQAVAEAIATLP